MTQLQTVGPPPQPPAKPEMDQTNQVVHLLLTLFTAGMWLVIWFFVAAVNSSNNRAALRRYAEQKAEYERKYAKWWDDYHRAYGHAPPQL